MRLILMRHGNTFESGQIPIQIGARTDLPLTEFGKEQARNVLRHLIDQKITPHAIFSGPLKRQAQSAVLIADYFGLEVKPAPLTEIDYGPWEGLSSEKIWASWPSEYEAWDKEADWPLGIFQTSFLDLKRTLEKWLRWLTANVPEDAVVFAVTSNGLLRSIHKEKVKTGNLCILNLTEEGFQLQSWNVPP